VCLGAEFGAEGEAVGAGVTFTGAGAALAGAGDETAAAGAGRTTWATGVNSVFAVGRLRRKRWKRPVHIVFGVFWCLVVEVRWLRLSLIMERNEAGRWLSKTSFIPHLELNL